MGRVIIDLADEDIACAQRRAKNAGFSTEEYLHDVLTANLRDEFVEIVERIGPPPELVCNSMERMEEMALEGLNSPSVVMTQEDFARRRLELIRKFSRQDQ